MPRIENLYALIALAFGAALIVVTPPFGAGDEPAHLERAYEIATWRLAGAEGVPEGMATLKARAFSKVVDGAAFSADDIAALGEIDLDADAITPYPNPFGRIVRVASPVAHVVLAPVMRVGLWLDLPPLVIFYMMRVASLLIGVVLIRQAIAIAPFQKHLMAFCALLPTAMSFNAAVSLESLTMGLAFLFFALVARHCAAREPIKTQDVALLAAIAFVFMQIKAAYFLVPMIALFIPAARFASGAAKLRAVAAIFLPAFLGAAAWSAFAKAHILGDLAYSTEGGDRVQPGEQMAHILSDPLGFLAIAWETMIPGGVLAVSWMGMIGLMGWTNILLNPLVYPALIAAMAILWLGEKPVSPLAGPMALCAQVTIAAASVGATLTLLYMQWTGVGAERIAGFQGRYLYPVLPLLFAAAPIKLGMLSSSEARSAIVATASSAGLIAGLFAVMGHYY